MLVGYEREQRLLSYPQTSVLSMTRLAVAGLGREKGAEGKAVVPGEWDQVVWHRYVVLRGSHATNPAKSREHTICVPLWRPSDSPLLSPVTR